MSEDKKLAQIVTNPVTGEELVISAPANGADQMIAQAIASNADIGVMERLLAMRRELRAEESRDQFFAALSAFQAEAPPVPKSKVVYNKDGKTPRYRYAPLDAVLKILQPCLTAHGFSYSFEPSKTTDGAISMTCNLHHIGGHRQSATVVVPSFAGHGTNAAQDVGSASQYGMRYSFLGVTGTTSADEDDDGVNSGPSGMKRAHDMAAAARANFATMLCIKENLAEGGDLSAAAEAYAELSKPEIMALNVAPSDFGLWTTEERRIMSAAGSKEFREMTHKHRTDAGWYDREENSL